MNTEQDDREQIEFMKEWVRKKEEKKRIREIRAKLRRERIYKIFHGGKRPPDKKRGHGCLEKRD